MDGLGDTGLSRDPCGRGVWGGPAISTLCRVRALPWVRKVRSPQVYGHVHRVDGQDGVLNLHPKYRIFVSPFSQNLVTFPSFLHHHCLQFLYPTNFLVRECFSLLVSSIFLLSFIIDYYYGKCPPPPPHSRFNYRHEQTPAFVWDHCKERGRILTRRFVVSFVCTILNIRKCRHGNASILHYALRNDYVYQFYALFIYMIPEDVLPGDSKAIGIICAL